MSRIQRLREQLYLLQGSRCFYCDNAIAVDERSLEHVIPSCNGGLADSDNAVVVCEAANQLLGSATPKQKIIMLKAGGGKIECPKKCGEHSGYTSGHDEVPANAQKQVRVVNSQANVGRNQVQKKAAALTPTDTNTTSPKSAKNDTDSQTPMTAKQKHKARSGHQSMPRPTASRRRR